MNIPKFTIGQNILKRVFYGSEKAITIYTEDKSSDKTFYKILLQRLLNSEIKINDIIPLGPKNIVIEESLKSLGTKNKSIFIVDSDIKIMEDTSIETDNLIPLNRYCIENYLCCPIGLSKLINIRTGIEETEVKKALNFDVYMQKNCTQLVKLYYRYLLSMKMNAGIPFKKASNFFNSPGPHIKVDSSLVRKEIVEIDNILKSMLKEEGIISYKLELDKKLKHIEQLNPVCMDTILRILSGKHQLIPILRLKAESIDPSIRSMNLDHVKRELADKISLESLDFLKRKILLIAG